MSEGHNPTGQIPFRLPLDLKAQVEKAADWRHMSINRWLVLATERALAVQHAEVQRLKVAETREQQLEKLFEQLVGALKATPGRRGATRAKLVEETNLIMDGDIPPPTPEIARIEKEYARIREKSAYHHLRPYSELTPEEQADQDFLVDLSWDQDDD